MRRLFVVFLVLLLPASVLAQSLGNSQIVTEAVVSQAQQQNSQIVTEAVVSQAQQQQAQLVTEVVLAKPPSPPSGSGLLFHAFP